ncbi:Endochitinase [Trichophyton interdigitale]|nr:Endochitinase [Trichophyton interdigitale]KAG5218192.1 Endochitinase [Trichophyton interdigitale]KAG8206602.1 Endochitinase [Trichophyton interdigitale]
MAASYTVQQGDYMWKIANDHGIALDALIAANPQVADPAVIQVGQVLNLPGAAGGTPAAAAAAAAPAPPPPAASAEPAAASRGVVNVASAVPSFQGGRQGLKTVGYFTNWGIYGRNYQPADIPASHLTHILYSFANVRPETGEVYLSDTYSDLEKHYPEDSWNDTGNNVYGCIKQLFLLKKQHRHFHTLLSIGGWTYSSNFAAPASTPQGRETFARSAVKLVANLGFDGIDIDWEYPKDDTEAYNFVLLLEAVRNELDKFSAEVIQRPDGGRLLLTVAAPCGASNYSVFRMADMDRYLDFWNMMCYDFAGSWDSKTGHQANLYPSVDNPASTTFSIDAALRAYMAGGVHPAKIICGLPLYGRAFEQTDGPGKPFQGVGEGSWENGIWDYHVLPKDGAEEYNDENLGASWSYSGSERKMISYDTPLITRKKVDYIRGVGLGGAMWWELSGDHPVDHERSLIKTVVEGFGGTGALEMRENNLNYPTSEYDNLRNGFP